MERCEHTGVSSGARKVGMICRLVQEEHMRWAAWPQMSHSSLALICYKSSSYVHTHTHAHTHASASTVLITSAVSKTRCGSQPQHCRCTLVATSCIASSLLPPHSAACLDDLSVHHKAQRTLGSHKGAPRSYSSPRPGAVGLALPTPTATKVLKSTQKLTEVLGSVREPQA